MSNCRKDLPQGSSKSSPTKYGLVLTDAKQVKATPPHDQNFTLPSS